MMGVRGSEAELSRDDGRSWKRSGAGSGGERAVWADNGCEVSMRSYVCECRGKVAKRAGWER
jgi:hypothetical protein